MPAKGELAGRSQLKAIAHWQLGRVVIIQKGVKREATRQCYRMLPIPERARINRTGCRGYCLVLSVAKGPKA